MGNMVTKTKMVDGSVYYYRADKNEPPDEPKISDRPLSDYETAALMSLIQTPSDVRVAFCVNTVTIGNGNSVSSFTAEVK